MLENNDYKIEIDAFVDNLFEKNPYSFIKLSEDTIREIRQFGNVKYLKILFKVYPRTYVFQHLAANSLIWEDISNYEWQDIMIESIRLTVPLYNIIAFIQQFTELNALDVYYTLLEEIKKVQIAVADNFEKYPQDLEMNEFYKKTLEQNNIVPPQLKKNNE